MALRPFSFPYPETRFFKAGSFIYKFKIRGGSSYSGDELMGGNCHQELEEIIRTVLSNPDSLQPFSSAHFCVFPYKKRWEGRTKMMCKYRKRNLKPYPFILILYLEKNMQTGKQTQEKLRPEQEVAQKGPSVSEPQKKRKKSTQLSEIEDGALKDLMKDLEGGIRAPVVRRLQLDTSRAAEEVKDDPDDNDMVEEEEEEEEEEEDADSAPEAPVKPGILTRIASSIFPFSMFFRQPTDRKSRESSTP